MDRSWAVVARAQVPSIAGHHQKLTWRHLVGRRDESLHWGGFPFEIGNRWREQRTGLEERDAVPGIPAWAHWTGDPFYDCYAHAEPGTQGLYSSAGFWRLGQALTYVWGRDLKDVVQECLFDAIGIPYERWDWLAGGEVKERKYLYPTIPDAYTYLDPPYEIGGQVVRSGRVGWSSAPRIWRASATSMPPGACGRECASSTPPGCAATAGAIRAGASGECEHFTAMGVVTTIGLPEYRHALETKSILPDDFFVAEVQPSSQRS